MFRRTSFTITAAGILLVLGLFLATPVLGSDSDREACFEPMEFEDRGLLFDIFPFIGRDTTPLTDIEPRGAEDLRSHKITPLIPEPMVFDLVRPLGEHRGAAEINILSLFPIGNHGRVLQYVDPLGIVHNSYDKSRVEWAPEYEVAIRDGLAIEFELPFEAGTLEALKTAAQWTIGTAFDDHYIHGIQTIIEPTVDFKEWNIVLLYIGGYRFDEVWSSLFMIGGRSIFGGAGVHGETELLFNFSTFANVSSHFTLGLESNFGYTDDGHASLLLTPQVHYEASDHFIIQTGLAVGFEEHDVSPFWVLRSIYSF